MAAIDTATMTPPDTEIGRLPNFGVRPPAIKPVRVTAKKDYHLAIDIVY